MEMCWNDGLNHVLIGKIACLINISSKKTEALSFRIDGKSGGNGMKRVISSPEGKRKKERKVKERGTKWTVESIMRLGWLCKVVFLCCLWPLQKSERWEIVGNMSRQILLWCGTVEEQCIGKVEMMETQQTNKPVPTCKRYYYQSTEDDR